MTIRKLSHFSECPLEHLKAVSVNVRLAELFHLNTHLTRLLNDGHIQELADALEQGWNTAHAILARRMTTPEQEVCSEREREREREREQANTHVPTLYRSSKT